MLVGLLSSKTMGILVAPKHGQVKLVQIVLKTALTSAHVSNEQFTKLKSYQIGLKQR